MTTNNEQQPTISRGLAIAIVILCEDDLLHSLPDRPFCSQEDCPCHQDEELFQEYIKGPMVAGELTGNEGLRLFQGKQLSAITLEGAFKCACPLMTSRCQNSVGAQNGVCNACVTGDHSGHWKAGV